MTPLLNARYVSFRLLCCSLAILMFATPSLPILAQEVQKEAVNTQKTLLSDPAVSTQHLSYVLPQSCLVVSLRPRQILTSKQLELLPIEVAQAASLKHTGLDPLKAEHVVVSVEPPMAGPPNYSVMATFTERVGKLNSELIAHTQPGELEGQRYFQSQDMFMPSIYSTDGKTLLAAPDMTVRKFVTGGATPEPSMLVKRLANSASDDLYMGVDLQPLRPFINQMLMQQQQEIPPEFQFLLSIPDLVRLVELRGNLTGKGPTELLVEANNEQDAKQIVSLLDGAAQVWIDKALEEAEKLKQKDDPVEQAMGRYIERVSGAAREGFMPKREGAKLVLFRMEDTSDSMGLVSTATIGVLVALLLPAVQAAREAARRNSSLNNMRQISLALLTYHDVRGQYPAYANLDENGKPLLSWRVHILPYLEQQALYEQFHLDEPWDSPHNKQLISQIPPVYLDPSSPADPTGGKTHYLGVAGKGGIFERNGGNISIRTVTDGTSNTITILQVNDERSAVWTKPVDWKYDEKNPLNGLKPNLHPTIFLAAFADGSVHSLPQEIEPSTLKKLLIRNDGEIVDTWDY